MRLRTGAFALVLEEDGREDLRGVRDPYQVFWPTYMAEWRLKLLGLFRNTKPADAFFFFFFSFAGPLGRFKRESR